MSKHNNDLRRVGLIKLGEREEGKEGRGIFGLKNVKTQFVRLRAHSSLSSYPPCFQKRRAETVWKRIFWRDTIPPPLLSDKSISLSPSSFN